MLELGTRGLTVEVTSFLVDVMFETALAVRDFSLGAIEPGLAGTAAAATGFLAAVMPTRLVGRVAVLMVAVRAMEDCGLCLMTVRTGGRLTAAGLTDLAAANSARAISKGSSDSRSES